MFNSIYTLTVSAMSGLLCILVLAQGTHLSWCDVLWSVAVLQGHSGFHAMSMP